MKTNQPPRGAISAKRESESFFASFVPLCGSSIGTELFTGDEGYEEFKPRIKDGGKDLTSERFKQLLEEHGCQVLSDKKLGQPDGVVWLKYGSTRMADRFFQRRIGQHTEAGRVTTRLFP